MSEAQPSLVRTPAAEKVRLSFVGDDSQVDVSLPLDVPIARLMPHVLKLMRSRDDANGGQPAESSNPETRHTVWMLRRHGTVDPLPRDITLRDAGVADGESLRLTPERALTVPTLYDDVVDAAARLNKAANPGWDARSAHGMASAGLYLTSAIWVYFLLDDTFASTRADWGGLSVAVVLALVGAAVVAERGFARSDIAGVMGCAALPIAAALAWTSLSGLGPYRPAATCAVMVAIAGAVYRAVGTGHGVYVGVGIVFGFTGLAFVLATTGVRTEVAGTGLAVIATLGCRAVPRFKSRSPFEHAQHDALDGDISTPPAMERFWGRMRSASRSRAGLYAGLAGCAGLGVSVVMRSAHQPQWPALAFAAACVAVIALHTTQLSDKCERAVLALSAVALTVLICLSAQDAEGAIPVVAFGALLTTTIALALIGARGQIRPRRRWEWAVVDYLQYLMTAAVIPLGYWVIGGFGRWGLA